MAAVRRRVRHARQFLAENAKKEGVISLPSGLQYKVIESGSGIKPRPGDRVTVHYRGTLINGSEFEYSYPTGAPAIVWLEDAIPGFQYALASMSMAPADPPPGSGGSRRRRATNSHNWPALARRVGRFLEWQGLLERDAENSYLAGDAVGEDQMDLLLGDAITYRIAVGLQAGRTVFTLQTLPASDSGDGFTDRVGQLAGFSLHAGVAAKAHERNKPERLCRYIARSPVSEQRLSLTAQDKVRYELKTTCNRMAAYRC